MPGPPAGDITDLLLAWSDGHQEALARLAPAVQAELLRLARRQLRGEAPGHSLQSVDLVNEAYLRLVDSTSVNWQNRAHFFAVAARVMRRILVDRARRKLAAKRGEAPLRVPLDAALSVQDGGRADLAALDDALEALAAFDPRKAQVVELRFFGGLDVKETALVLGTSTQTVVRDWKIAKLWLLSQLDHAPARAGTGGKR